MSYVEYFLQINGFERVEKGRWQNDKCEVIELPFNGGHRVRALSSEDCYYTGETNIYHLVGYLIWNDFIHRDFKTIEYWDFQL